MSRLIVGLTGGIGSGKTTVANLFAAHGICLVDADIIAREVVAMGSPALASIAATFGPEALHTDGSLNRAWLRKHVFSDDSAKQQLNQIVHPLIRQQIIAQLQQASSAYVLLVAPLLVENGLTALTEQVLVVDVSEHTQIQRTRRRDNVEQAQIEAIIAAQCPRTERLAHATQIIDNDAEHVDLTEKVAELHAFYLQLAAEKLAKSPA